MSIRAYRVISEKLGPESFNLWHDSHIIDWLSKNGDLDFLNMDCSGSIEIHVDDLRTMLTDLKDLMTMDAMEQIFRDIFETEKENKEYVKYSCF